MFEAHFNCVLRACAMASARWSARQPAERDSLQLFWLLSPAVCMQGLSSGFCERLHQWRFDPKCNFKIVAGPGLPHPEHPSALRTVLRQVQGVDTTGPLRLRLTGWHLDPSDAAHIYVERLPSLHQFNVHVECGRLTDELLSALLSAPTCDTVSANKFHLSSNHHTETWRIGTLWLSCLKATQLNKLPGPPPRCDLRCKELRMDNLLHVSASLYTGTLHMSHARANVLPWP